MPTTEGGPNHHAISQHGRALPPPHRPGPGPNLRFAAPQHNAARRSEEHTSELQSLMRISYAVFCLKKKNSNFNKATNTHDISDSHTQSPHLKQNQQHTRQVT